MERQAHRPHREADASQSPLGALAAGAEGVVHGIADDIFELVLIDLVANASDDRANHAHREEEDETRVKERSSHFRTEIGEPANDFAEIQRKNSDHNVLDGVDQAADDGNQSADQMNDALDQAEDDPEPPKRAGNGVDEIFDIAEDAVNVTQEDIHEVEDAADRVGDDRP